MHTLPHADRSSLAENKHDLHGKVKDADWLRTFCGRILISWRELDLPTYYVPTFKRETKRAKVFRDRKRGRNAIAHCANSWVPFARPNCNRRSRVVLNVTQRRLCRAEGLEEKNTIPGPSRPPPSETLLLRMSHLAKVACHVARNMTHCGGEGGREEGGGRGESTRPDF